METQRFIEYRDRIVSAVSRAIVGKAEEIEKQSEEAENAAPAVESEIKSEE